MTLELYDRNGSRPIISHAVDVLDTAYVDSWRFEKAGDYKVVVKIVDHLKPDELIQYEVNASVVDAGAHGDHGFFAHHFGGGHWGWWGAGLMLIMMPLMILL